MTRIDALNRKLASALARRDAARPGSDAAATLANEVRKLREALEAERQAATR